MAAFDHPVTISAYALLLASNATLPTSATTAGGTTRVDTAGIRSRVVRLPAPPRAYQSIHIAAPGIVYLVDGNPLGGGPTQVSGVSRSVWRLTWSDKKVEEVLRDADAFDVIANRSTALVRKGGRSTFIELADLRAAQGDVPPTMPAGRALTIPTLPATIDVRAEWKQIYHETWRLQRDLFYTANYNGLDLAKAEATYARFVAGLGSRSDLTYLMREMLTNLSVSHLAVNDPPADDAVGGRGGGRGRGGGGGRGGDGEPSGRAGVLGVDVAVDHDRYRIARVYRGDVWLGGATGPLAQPGVDVREGEYIRSIDGHDLTAADNLDRALDGTAGRSIQLGISNDPASEVRVVAVTPGPQATPR
jgi:tricorn protease